MWLTEEETIRLRVILGYFTAKTMLISPP